MDAREMSGDEKTEALFRRIREVEIMTVTERSKDRSSMLRVDLRRLKGKELLHRDEPWGRDEAPY